MTQRHKTLESFCQSERYYLKRDSVFPFFVMLGGYWHWILIPIAIAYFWMVFHHFKNMKDAWWIGVNIDFIRRYNPQWRKKIEYAYYIGLFTNFSFSCILMILYYGFDIPEFTGNFSDDTFDIVNQEHRIVFSIPIAVFFVWLFSASYIGIFCFIVHKKICGNKNVE